MATKKIKNNAEIYKVWGGVHFTPDMEYSLQPGEISKFVKDSSFKTALSTGDASIIKGTETLSVSEATILSEARYNSEDALPRFAISYVHPNNLNNDWLSLTDNSSYLIERVITTDCQLIAAGFLNFTNEVSLDLEFYKNGTKVYTWEIRLGSEEKKKTHNLVSELIFEAGDTFKVFGRGQGITAQNVTLDILFQNLG